MLPRILSTKHCHVSNEQNAPSVSVIRNTRDIWHPVRCVLALRTLTLAALFTLLELLVTSAVYAQPVDAEQGYRQLNFDDVFLRRREELLLIDDSPLRVGLEFMMANIKEATKPDSSGKGQLNPDDFLSFHLDGKIIDKETVKLRMWGTVLLENISKPDHTSANDKATHAQAVATLATDYVDASGGIKYDGITSETSVTGTLNIDPAFLGFRSVKPTVSSVFGQLLQGGSRLNARKLKRLHPTARDILGTLALQYQRIGDAFDAGMFEARSLYDFLYAHVAHDFQQSFPPERPDPRRMKQ